MVDRDWVNRIALLARLKLREEEVEVFSKQLAGILELVEQLEEVDTSNVEPYIERPENTPMREDVPDEGLTQDKALMNAPHMEGGFFVVPRIVEV